jgi:hypothetical protein
MRRAGKEELRRIRGSVAVVSEGRPVKRFYTSAKKRKMALDRLDV